MLNFFHIWWFNSKICSTFDVLHFEKSSNMAKTLEKSCSTCLKPISPQQCEYPKPQIWQKKIRKKKKTVVTFNLRIIYNNKIVPGIVLVAVQVPENWVSGTRIVMYDFHDSTETLKFWTENRLLKKLFCFSSDFDVRVFLLHYTLTILSVFYCFFTLHKNVYYVVRKMFVFWAWKNATSWMFFFFF